MLPLVLLVITEIAIAISLQAVSLWYASYITKKPLDRTWLSVTYGVSGTLLFASLSFLVFLMYLDLLHLWWIGLPFALGFGISGWIMIYFQEQKFQEQLKRTQVVNKRFNGDLYE